MGKVSTYVSYKIKVVLVCFSALTNKAGVSPKNLLLLVEVSKFRVLREKIGYFRVFGDVKAQKSEGGGKNKLGGDIISSSVKIEQL